jgi:hypothetical protein
VIGSGENPKFPPEEAPLRDIQVASRKRFHNDRVSTSDGVQVGRNVWWARDGFLPKTEMAIAWARDTKGDCPRDAWVPIAHDHALG